MQGTSVGVAFEWGAHLSEIGILLVSGISAWVNISSRIKRLEVLMELLMKGRQLLKVKEQ